MKLFSRVPSFRAARHVAVLDVGSGSVAAAVASVSDDGKPVQVLAAKRFVLPVEGREQSQREAGIVRLATEASEFAAAEYAKLDTKRPVVGVYAIFHAPWSTSHTVKAEETLREPTTVNKQLIQRIAERAFEKDAEPNDENMYERVVVRTELNGYPTAEPEGKRARTISTTLLISTINSAIEKGVKNAATASFAGRPLVLRSANYALTRVLGESSQLNPNYTIADCTSEAIAITTVREGDITGNATIPFGVRTVLLDVEKATGIPADELRSRFRMMSEDACTDEACEPIFQALSAREPEYVKLCGEALAPIAEKQRMPNALILVVASDMAGWAEPFFSKLDFGQFTQTGKAFVPRRITARTFASQVEKAARASSVKLDSGICIATVFARAAVLT